jgi:hypothetical protein
MSQLPKTDNLVVRQHERLRCALTAEATIAPEHIGPITLSPLAADASGNFNPVVVDVSRGGIGLRTKVFLPKQARICVTITDPAIGTPISTTVRVQRVIMTDRAPTYELGTAFVDPSPGLLQTIAAAIARLQQAASPVATGAARG